MTTARRLKLGPLDHGRRLNRSAFEEAEYDPGFRYEIIDGRLYVSPMPNFPEHWLELWLCRAVERYADRRPDVISLVANKGRVFLPEAVRLTVPEPDLAAYASLPEDAEFDEVSWEDLSPVLVAEVLVGGSIEKDLGRNPQLYLAVPSIKEYWVLDGSDVTRQPTLIQHRRRGKKWVVTPYPYQSTFTTSLLPGFELVIDPRPRRRR
ncbi:MAG TPA: Uma2 family endonuclease [Gemmataceae bacterium]|nr:Uma2 family endonuclease [Gemmataceae bacterium]